MREEETRGLSHAISVCNKPRERLYEICVNKSRIYDMMKSSAYIARDGIRSIFHPRELRDAEDAPRDEAKSAPSLARVDVRRTVSTRGSRSAITPAVAAHNGPRASAWRRSQKHRSSLRRCTFAKA